MPGPQPIRYYNLYPSRNKSTTCTLPKNHPQNLSKKSKTTLDNSHTHCYNNQAVSRRTRREKRFITACICFLKKKFFKKLSENLLTIKRFWYIIYKLSRRRDSTAGPWKLNKTETCGTLIVCLEIHVNQFQILQVIHTGRKRLCLSDYSDLTLLNGD